MWTQHLFLRFNDDWSRAVCSFANKLREILGGELLCVVASPREDLLFHGCNVVVVVREDTLEVRRKVVEAEREVEEEHKWEVEVAPMIVNEREEDEVRRFIAAYESEVTVDEWREAVDDFTRRLRGVLGGELLCVVASPREDLLFHGCNVVVVVREDTLEVRRKVVEAERETEKEYKWRVGIAPVVVREEEKDAYLEAFG